MRDEICPGVLSTASLALTLLLAACGDVEVKPEETSGEDFEKAGAQLLPFDKLTDDYISFEEGDVADWKFVKIKTPGILTVTVYWDNKEIKSLIDVFDRFATPVDSRKHTKKLEKDKLEIRVKPGTHFIQLHTEEGSSVYTIEAKFEPFDWELRTDLPPVADEEIPLDEPLPGDLPSGSPRVAVGRTRVHKGGGGGRPAAEPSGAISGTIMRMVPGARKKSTVLTIRLSARDHGVKRGDRGEILDRDGRMKGGDFEIINIRGTSATARTNLSPNDIAHRRRVRIFTGSR